MKELEMILAAISQLGETGREVFLWWLFVDKGVALLCVVSLCLCVGFIAKLISNGTSKERILTEMYLQMYGEKRYLFDQEIQQMRQWIEDRKK